MKVSTNGLSRAEVLSALYNGANQLGLGQLHYHPKPMDVNEAQEILNRIVQQAALTEDAPLLYLDIYEGKALKVDLTPVDEFESFQFDRENGEGKAQEIIDIALAAKQS